MSNHPGFATVRVQAELSLTALMALYWDAVVDKIGDADEAQWIAAWGYSKYTNANAVRAIVREWLTWYGERSVECGPRNEYPNEQLEASVKAIVARAFEIVY